MFYTGVQSSVNVNGCLSPFFSLSCGVRQGCPLSPLLYVLVAEVLACNIPANPCIKGLCLPGSSDPLSLISQYTDDTSLVVCTDEAICACFAVYDTYERVSGSKLNLSKSKGLWLGPLANRSDPPVALEWSSVKIKVLVSFWVPGTSMMTIGSPALLWWRTLYPPGVSESCPFRAVPCYQCSSFVQGVVCGFSHSHAPLGRWGTAEAGLQLFLEGQEGSCCASCGCPGTLSWWVLGSGC